MLETTRLRFRPWQPTDLDWVARMNADPHVMRHFPKRLDREESAAAVTRYQRKTERDGYCFTPAILKATGQPVGMIGLGYSPEAGDGGFGPYTEIGWRLLPEFWGRGLAPEGARAWLDYAFSILELPEVVAQTAVQNQPSQRVMEKIGMQPAFCFRYTSLNAPAVERTVVYRVRAGNQVTRSTPRIIT